MLGLAIYNAINLDLKFPQVVYKKLLDEEVTFEVISVVNRAKANNSIEYRTLDYLTVKCTTV